ncbi:MAG: 3-methyl-2-oxobutanoate hydroxymethyltransferase [Candidatus Fraserbacteria bacterium RBG_16_55_9]|uniref:3-methyl-2-oxobutanoate hydroxymethyltransferase n=1 Tax=Fraserbacteria sp. (strain RBG_16_55_9) TaxID=1817864 RepID=A0A1F5UNY7_FRAXR|nr:MAG: 3-methyl-2-oxobutanoate hydroxymethyltransferase [Candidatus Fraserbacteria bacterium RBG_16_55_9]
MKARGEKITMLTAYDYPTAVLMDRAGIEVVLVGDSVGNNVLGYESTVPVTLEEMLHHTKAVRRGLKRAFLIGDMPFLSFNVSHEQAITNAGRFLKEAGVDAVKLEGGEEMAERVKALERAGIAVMGHIGFTPQRASQLGGAGHVQGRDEERARELLKDARSLEEAGAFSIVLEKIPWPLAELITKSVKIPTMGIGAGPYCDGQVLVTHDVLGLSGLSLKFAKRYVDLSSTIEGALKAFKEDVKAKKFPTVEEHSFSMPEDVLKKLAP